MKIATFDELLTMPAGTIYREFYGNRYFGLCRKGENFIDEDGEVSIREHDLASDKSMFGREYLSGDATREFAVYEAGEIDWLAGMIGRGPMVAEPGEPTI